MLTGDNGILTQADKAKDENIKGQEKEQIRLAMQSKKMEKIADNVGREVTGEELENQLLADGAKNVTVENISGYLKVKYEDSKNEYLVDQDGQIEEETGPIEQPENVAKYWEVTRKTDTTWFSYNDLEKNKEKVKVNAPKLVGNMKAIKYVGTDANAGSKWANAMTSDGSMFVWIPRYAYRITEGYHDKTAEKPAGKIDVIFIDTNNKSLNGETEEITTNVEDPEAGKTKYLVHPAFTANAEAGGGFGELAGIWVGKFEATGTYSNGDASKVSVKPGVASLRSMTVNEQYKAGMKATYGESGNLNSHMAKNSEWGATVYLAHSKYGTNGKKVERSNLGYTTGGTNVVEQIYTTNKTQSTTHNATGVYDLNGGAWERTASYVNNKDKQLGETGGTNAGDFYGTTENEQATSTKYKTVYSSVNNQLKDYETAGKKNKGDAVFETSISQSNGTGSWFEAYAYFPYGGSPFFFRGGGYSDTAAGTFYFSHVNGNAYGHYSFRPVLAP